MHNILRLKRFFTLYASMMTLAFNTSCHYVGTATPDQLTKIAGPTTPAGSSSVVFSGLTSLTADQGNFNLTWNAATSNASSQITYTVFSGNFATQLGTTTALTYTVPYSQFKSGDTASFSVRATDGLKFQDSNTVVKSVVLSGVAFCSPFTFNSAVAASDTRVNLNFATCSGATSYAVFSKTSVSGNADSQIDTIAASSSGSSQSYLLSGLTPGKSYTLYLRPYDTTTNPNTPVGGINSNTKTVQTYTSAFPVFNGIATAVAESGSLGMTNVDLTWLKGQASAALSGTLKYQIFFSTNSANVFSSGSQVATGTSNNAAEGNYIPSANTTSATVTGLLPSTTYYFGVRAYQLDSSGAVNEEQNSVILSATTNSPNNSQTPTITSVAPSISTPAGGTTVTITGTNFNPGSAITFGGTAGTSTTWVSSTTMTSVVPAHAAGVVNVGYTSSTGVTATLSQGFSFTSNAAPTIASINKNQVYQNGGDAVTITGTGYVAGALVLLAGSTITTSVVTATSITFTVVGSSAGTYDLVVQNPDLQKATLRSAITFLGDPTITSASPGVISTAGGATVTLTGTNFQTPMTVTIHGTACSVFNYVSSTQMQCTAGAPSGLSGTNSSDIIVTNGASRSATLTSGIIYSSTAAPIVTSITPGAGPIGGNRTITITGSGFVSGGSASVLIGSVACSNISFVSSTSITCQPAAVSSSGTFAVTVVNSDTQQSNSNFTYVYTTVAAPFLSTISPNNRVPTGTVSITLSGTGFSSPSVTIGSAACTVTSSSSTQIVCNSAAATAGAYNVTVTNGDTQTGSLSNGLIYSAVTLTSIYPTYGSRTNSGSSTISIYGANIVSGAVVSVGGTACTTTTYVNSGRLTCVYPSSASSGIVNVSVALPDLESATLSNSFTYLGPVTVTSVSPTMGSMGGGETLTVSGSGFVNGTTLTIGGTSCTVTFVSATQITCPSPGSSTNGAASIVATNPDLQSNTLSSAYTFRYAPYLETIGNNDNLAIIGGGVITLYGYRFDTNATITLTDSSNNAYSCGSVTYTSTTQITCTLTALAAGNYTVTVTNLDSQTSWITNGILVGSQRTFSTVTTWVGPTHAIASVDGTGSAARIANAWQLVNDGTYIYFADNIAHVIRRFDPSTNIVTTIAGATGIPGDAVGAGTSARFTNPRGLFYDSGTSALYVADHDNGKIKKIALPGYSVSTFATFSNVIGIDGDGTNIYAVAGDAPAACVIKQILISGATVSNTWSPASTYCSGGIKYLSGALWVASQSNMLSIDLTSLVLSTLAAAPVRAPSFTVYSGQIILPDHAPNFGRYWTYNTSSNTFTSSTSLYSTGNFSYPVDGAVGTGAVSNGIGGPMYWSNKLWFFENSFETFNSSLAMNQTATGSIRYIDFSTSPNNVVSLAGGYQTKGQSTGAAGSTLFGGSYPAGGVNYDVFLQMVAINDTLYVPDYTNHIIVAVNAVTGTSSLFAGSPGVSGSATGNRLTAALFNGPASLATDGINLYVRDRYLVKQINLVTGTVSLIAGTYNSNALTDGTGTSAKFTNALSGNQSDGMGLTTDGSSIWTADEGGSYTGKIRKIVISSGVVTTPYGATWGGGGYADTGAASGLRLARWLTALLSPDKSTFYYQPGTNVYYFGSFTISSAIASLISGTGVQGSTDGAAASATINVTANFKSQDGVYAYFSDCADTGFNCYIRRMSLVDYSIQTVLMQRSGSYTSTSNYDWAFERDGTNITAGFVSPRQSAILPRGNKLYIYNSTNIRVAQ